MNKARLSVGLIACCVLLLKAENTQAFSSTALQREQTQSTGPIALFKFEENTNNSTVTSVKERIGGIISYGIVAVTLAFFRYGIWSFIWATLAQSLTISLLSWIMNPWKPKAYFNVNKFKKLFRSNMNVIGTKIIVYLKYHIQSDLILWPFL